MEFHELLCRAKNDDIQAKEELFLQYRGMIVNRSMINGKFSEDLYQELSKTFLICIERFHLEDKRNENETEMPPIIN